MPSSSTAVMTTANAVLRLLIVLCIIGGVMVSVLLAVSYVFPEQALSAIRRTQPSVDALALLNVSRMILAFAVVATLLGQFLLWRLSAIVRTVRAGDPFVPVNARLLRHIAWALLGLQICDLGFGYAVAVLPSGADDVSGWSMSLTGWIAVLLLFILARVFEHGTRMRDELEGTV